MSHLAMVSGCKIGYYFCEVIKMSLPTVIKDGNAALKFLINKSFPDDSHKEMGRTDITLFTMLSSMLDKADTIRVMVQGKRVSEMPIIQRSMFELEMSLKFILLKDTQRRASAYFCHQRLESAQKAKRFIDVTSDRNLAQKIETGINSELQKGTHRHSIDEEIAYWEPQYKGLFKTGANRRNFRYWFDIDLNIGSIADLAKSVGMYDAYLGLYAFDSMSVHAADVTNNFTVTQVSGANNSKALLEIFSARIDSDVAERVAQSQIMETIIEIAKFYHLKNSNEIQLILRKYSINLKLNR